MSYHILHLLSHHLRVRLKLDQLHIEDRENGTERTVPLADIAVIVTAAPDLSVTAGALRRMAELNVLMLVCNEKFEPCVLTLPYYRATNTELLRRQIEWTPEWKQSLWRQVVTAKVRNQAANLAHLKRANIILTAIADRCAIGTTSTASLTSLPNGNNGNAVGRASSRAELSDSDMARQEPRPTEIKISLATLTASKRAAFLSDSPAAHESRAARHYWKHLLPRLSEAQSTDERRRVPGTRDGVNGMLDYGYAILRTAVLRSLAAHGFIAAIGIHHAAKAGSFALADDIMEPLRPFVDRELRLFLQGGERPMKEWMQQVVKVLALEVPMGKSKVRFLNAIDLYVQSFADAAMLRANSKLKIPMLA